MNHLESPNETTIRQMVWSFMDTFGSKIIYMIIQLFLARLLTPSDFGVFGIVSIFIVLSTVLYDSGFTTGLLRDKESSQEDYSTVFIYNMIVASILYIILFVFASLISGFFDTPQMYGVIRVLGTVLIIDAFGFMQRVQLTKNLQFNILMKVNISSSIVSGVIGIGFALSGFGIWSLVIKAISAQLLQAILYTYYNRWRPSLIFNKKSFERLFSFGWKILVSKLFSQFYENLYALIIGSGFSMTTLGFYSNAQRLSTSASYSIEASVEKVSYPLLSKFQDDDEKLKSAFKKTFKNTVFIIFPVMLILAAIAPALFRLILGDNWLPAIPYFQIMCFAGIFTPLHSLNLNILQIKGRSDLYLKKSILGNLIATIVVGGVLLFNLGIYGLLWGLVVDYFISYFNNASHTKKLINYSIIDQLKDIKPIFVISVIVAVLVYSLNYVSFINDMLLLSTQLFISTVLYTSISYVYKIKELNTIIQLLEPIQKRIFMKKLYNKN